MEYFSAKEDDCKDKVQTLHKELESLKVCFNASFNKLLSAVEANSSPTNECKCVCLSAEVNELLNFHFPNLN